MKKEFLPYQEALELKELGFDEPCFSVYIDKTLIMEDDWLYSTNQDTFIESSNFTAPLYQQAFRWFREKYELCGIPSPLGYEILDKDHPTAYWGCIKEEILESYEEAELACLKKLIEIVKNQ